jgi:hypothetical protein
MLRGQQQIYGASAAISVCAERRARGRCQRSALDAEDELTLVETPALQVACYTSAGSALLKLDQPIAN